MIARLNPAGFACIKAAFRETMAKGLEGRPFLDSTADKI
jgi:hypothetical protein